MVDNQTDHPGVNAGEVLRYSHGDARGVTEMNVKPKRRIRYSVAMSLDGYIAGPKGEFDWIIMDPDIDFTEIYSQFDTLLIGRRTFEPMVGAEGPSMKGIKTYVFSRTLQQSDYPDVTIVNDNVSETLQSLRNAPGKDIWLFGGGLLFRSLADAGFVDSVEVAIIPVLLGEGIPLVPAPVRQMNLELTSHRIFEKTGTVALEYQLKTDDPH